MITKQHIIRWLELSAALFAEKKEYLTELDSAIGDADHGINMARGFKFVSEKLPEMADDDIGKILKTTGMTLMSKVGGASGPLYGTFFMKAAAAVPDKAELDAADLVSVLDAGVEGLIKRGRAELGDKTMVDALSPAIDAMKAAQSDGEELPAVIKAGVDAAEKGVEATIPLVAKKGRASYLGERSAGHPDPGATSSFYLLGKLAEAITKDE